MIYLMYSSKVPAVDQLIALGRVNVLLIYVLYLADGQLQ